MRVRRVIIIIIIKTCYYRERVFPARAVLLFSTKTYTKKIRKEITFFATDFTKQLKVAPANKKFYYETRRIVGVEGRSSVA